MTTQLTTRTEDILEQTRRILGGAVQSAATASATCCSPAKQETCCDSSEKEACCGTAGASAGGCGCQ